MNAQEFLRRIVDLELTTRERAVALLWWAGRDDPTTGLTSRAICRELENAGFPQQNVSRLESQLLSDRRTVKASGGGWRLRPQARVELDATFAFAHERRRAEPSDSVLPRDLFRGTRGYIERVVSQINRSYEAELWDCCAVMCRRLVETLIIEVYEHERRADTITGADGHFLTLNGLIVVMDADASVNVSRNANRALANLKHLGDLSAHNRRFNARRDDIDRVRDGLRVVTEELLHLAGFARGN